MKGILFVLSVIFVVIVSSPVANAQDSWFSFDRITMDIALSYGGSYALQGNTGGNELRAVGRKTNNAEGSLLGTGLALNYKIIKGLEVFYSWHYEYGNEELVETLAYIMKDYGVRYSFHQLGSIRPFVKAAYATFKLDGLKLYDYNSPSTNPTFEDDYLGGGFRYGLGIDLWISETLTYSLEYNGFSFSSFEGADTNKGNVEFENQPDITTYRFYVRITF